MDVACENQTIIGLDLGLQMVLSLLGSSVHGILNLTYTFVEILLRNSLQSISRPYLVQFLPGSWPYSLDFCRSTVSCGGVIERIECGWYSGLDRDFSAL